MDSARHVLQVLCMMTFETLPWTVRHGTRIKSKSCKGSFFNYVDQILPVIDHLPTSGWHWWSNSFNVIRENLHTIDISSTTYLPRLVNVVKERPTKESKDFAWTELRTEVVRMLGLFVPILPQSVRWPSQGILHVVCLLFLIEKKIKLCLICFAWLFLPDCEVVEK